jgi:hypothetical protein
MTASIRIGIVGSIDPVGVNLSRPDRWPHWKIHTTTPNVADSDSTFITIAFSGSTTDLNVRNSSTNVETPTSSAIHGSVARGWPVRPPAQRWSRRPARWAPAKRNGEVSGEVSRIGMTMCLAADDTVGGW